VTEILEPQGRNAAPDAMGMSAYDMATPLRRAHAIDHILVNVLTPRETIGFTRRSWAG
jgi:hypothetical protein